MKTVKIKKISKIKKKSYDLIVQNNHNFFANNFLIHNSSYRGEYGVILHNHSKGEVFFAKGTKIAQLVFQKYETIETEIVQELSNTSRGEGGYGSTDKK